MADPEPHLAPAPPDSTAQPAQADLEKKLRKKAKKARAVWISFAGRILAQILGAVASVALGLLLLQRYQAASSPSTPPAPAGTAAGAAPPEPAQPAVSRPSGEAAIAVLPLANLSGDPGREYFADGMTEALVASLAQIDGLRVISRTSTLRYKTERATIPEIARALGVTLVLEGSVMLAGDQVRITAQLIDGATDEHVWAQSYTRRLRDVIALQDEVAATIGREVLGTVTRRPGGRAGQARAVDPSVYDLYLRGRHAWSQRTTEGMRAAIDYFSRAVAADESFALGHVGLADAYVLQGSPGMGPLDLRGAMDRAQRSAMRALDIDPSLAEAHTALAGVLFFGDRNYEAAEQAFNRALTINPNYSVAHEWLAVLLAELGRDREARGHAEQAVALSPLEGTMHQALGLVHYYARRYVEAVRAERRALELASSLPLARALLVKALVLGGDAASALAACGEIAAASDQQDILVACAVAYGRSGRTAEIAAVRARLEGLRPAPGVGLSQLEAALGDYEAAFNRLERLAARGNLPPALGFDPLFDGLRRDPRWPGIQARKAPAPPPRGS